MRSSTNISTLLCEFFNSFSALFCIEICINNGRSRKKYSGGPTNIVSREDGLGKNLHYLIVPEQYHSAQENGFKPFRRSGDGAAVGKTLELSGKRSDGTEFPIELSLAGVRIKDAWHSIGIMRDISERKQVETALNDSRESN